MEQENHGQKRILFYGLILMLLFLVIINLVLEKTWKSDTASDTTIKVALNGDSEEIAMASQKNKIQYSANDFFYADDISLTLSCSDPDVVEIYYTDNGDLPDTESGILYNKPLKLTKTDNAEKMINSYTIRACGKRADGSFTKVQTHSYFIGTGIDKRFDCLVVSVTTPGKNLYDYETGIFVPGKLRDDYMNTTGNKTPNPDADANYNVRGIESERPAYVEMFTMDGTCIISQEAGMRIAGGWSRANEQKSIKLIARSRYDEGKGSFDYEFFPEETTRNHTKITSYKHLILRSCANDWPYTFLRDESIMLCADETPLYDTQKTRPVAVFLNGEYYGFSWLHECYDEDYLNAKNGNESEEGEWVKLSGGEINRKYDSENPLEAYAGQEYEKINSCADKDLTDDVLFAKLKEWIDIDNFLWYYAIQVYIGNDDWPDNNNDIYRYFSKKQAEAIQAGQDPQDNASALLGMPYAMDGKYRWLLYDTDFGLGLYESSPYDKDLIHLLEPDGLWNSPFLISVLKREDMQRQFVTILCDLMYGSFSPEKLKKAIYQKEKDRLHELTYDYSYGSALSHSFSNLSYVSHYVSDAISYAAQRPAAIISQVKEHFSWAQTLYDIQVDSCEHADIHVNSYTVKSEEESHKGRYFNDCEIKLSANIEDGYEFSHWLINGQMVTEPQLICSENDSIDNNIKVQLLVVPVNSRLLPVIKQLDYTGKNDKVVLNNPFQSVMKIKYLCLSDDPDNLQKYILSNISLDPMEELTLYGKGYQGLEALNHYGLNFNLKQGESLYLSTVDGTIVEEVPCIAIHSGNFLLRDPMTHHYKETSTE